MDGAAADGHRLFFAGLCREQAFCDSTAFADGIVGDFRRKIGVVIVHIVIVPVAAAEQNQSTCPDIERDIGNFQRFTIADIGHRQKCLHAAVILIEDTDGDTVAGTLHRRGVIDCGTAGKRDGDIAACRELIAQHRVIVQTGMDVVLLDHAHLEIVFAGPPVIADKRRHIFPEIGTLGCCHKIPSVLALFFGDGCIDCVTCADLGLCADGQRKPDGQQQCGQQYQKKSLHCEVPVLSLFFIIIS